MKFIFSILTLLIFHFGGYCQSIDHDFDSLVKSFGPRVGPFYEDSISIPVIYKGKDFMVKLADSSLNFDTKFTILDSPVPGESYPLSYSVIYRDHIVSLFEPGIFVCFSIKELNRNKDFEEALNKRKFKAHSLIDGKLVALSKFGFWYEYSSNKWRRIKNIAEPNKSKSHLYSDDAFIVYNECNGEFGGTIYFYHRESKKTYFTSATCANTVFKDKDGFKVLSHLGHGMGSADFQLIPDPTKLPDLKDFKVDKKSIEALGYKDTTNYSKEIFDFYWIQVFSMFKWNEQSIYMVHWQNKTFLAEIDETEILIIDPLFNSDMYTHEPITTKYDEDLILINLDFWGIGRDREVSLIMIKGKEITKIDWNNKH